MQRHILLSLALLLVFAFGVFGSVNAEAIVEDFDFSCDSFSASGTTNANFVVLIVINALTANVEAYDVLPGPGSFDHSMSFNELDEDTVLRLQVYGATGNSIDDYDYEAYFEAIVVCGANDSDDDGDEPGPPCENLFDGRLNDHQGLDCAAPVAIYAGADSNSVDIYAIDPATGDGTLVMRASAPATGDTHVLIQSAVNPFTGATISLYWLSSGEYQLRTTHADGKLYDVVWDADGNMQHLAA